MRNQYHRPVNRPFRSEEKALFRWLISHGTAEAAQYAAQVERVQVVSECSCGCPTIGLALDGRLVAQTGGSLIISDLVGTSPEGHKVNVILHVRGEELSELEVYACDGSDVLSLPKPEDLKRWEDASV
jgi:hypothetical protein